MAVPSAVSLSCLAFVVAAGVGFAAVSSNAAEDKPSPRAAAPSTTTPTTTLRPSLSPQPRPAEPKPQSKPQSKPEPTSKPKPERKPKPKPVDVVPKVLVEVYNNSGVSGLAADKASVLADAGWNVAATDNWYGSIPANTVYYPAQLAGQASRLAKTLHVSRVRPAVSPMQFDRLTVIFTTP